MLAPSFRIPHSEFRIRYVLPASELLKSANAGLDELRVSDLLADGWSVWTTEEPLRCAVMLTMLFGSGLALIVEVFCRRMGVVTRWQLPWSGD